MADIQIGKAPEMKAVLPFYGTAAVFFLVLSVLLLLTAAELTGHYFSPHVLAVVHTAALGWGSMVIFGATYQLLPVICEKDLYSAGLAFVSYLFLVTGTILLVVCFWLFHVGAWMITGGSLVVSAALLYTINIGLTASGKGASSVFTTFLIIAAMWLCITTIAGQLLAINLSHTFIPRNHLDMLKLHAHAGLAGWFLQLITGVSARLVPMFLLGKSGKTWLLYAALVLQNAGLVLFLADGYFNPVDGGMLKYAVVVGLGVLAWLAYLADAWRRRLRKKTEPLMWHAGVSMISLLLGLVLLPLTFYAADTKWTALYGTFLFLGWITGLILGKTFKTLPFIVWNNRYRHLHGKAGVPLPKQLYRERLIIWQFYVYLCALLLLVAGVVLDELWVIRVALSLWLVVALIYLRNVLHILFHKPRVPHESIPQ